jgi:thioredoxin 2
VLRPFLAVRIASDLPPAGPIVVAMNDDSEIIACPACGGANRVQRARVADGANPVCGHCKASLSVDVTPVAVTDASFAAEVVDHPRPVIVDLWAEWCPPCRMIAPALEEFASEFMGRVRIAKLNVDENPRTQAQLGVTGIPTLVAYKGGREVDRQVGALPPPQLRTWIAQFA